MVVSVTHSHREKAQSARIQPMMTLTNMTANSIVDGNTSRAHCSFNTLYSPILSFSQIFFAQYRLLCLKVNADLLQVTTSS